MLPIIGAGIMEMGSKLIDKLIPDPEAKAKAQLELVQLQQAGQLKELEVSMSAILAEANSNDPWVSRSRPMFLYVFYFVILSMAIFAPAVGLFFPGHMEAYFLNVNRGFQAIPDAVWDTFTAGYLGYCAARTIDKNGVKLPWLRNK